MKKNKSNKAEIGWLFGIANFIFIVLYRKILFGDKAYVFGGIGSDTNAQYFPYYVFDAEHFMNGNLFEYSLQMGLGGEPYERIMTLVNPFEIVLLFCNNNTMHIGLIVSLYLKLMFIAIVSYLYFGKLFSNVHAKIVCALVWTYSGYITLWGQHYEFCTCMAYFTLFMYVLQIYLENECLYNKWIPLVIFIFTLKGYYMLYMVGVYSVIYIVAYGFIKNFSFKKILKKIFGLGIMAVLGVMMAAFYIMVSVGNLLNSSRTDSMSFNVLNSISNFRDAYYWIAIVGRILSANMFGIDNFAAWGNYYETPILSTTLLMMFSVVYSFMENGKGKRAILYVVGIFSILNAGVSLIMTAFVGEYLRWTFVLTFSMIIGIGYMFNKICGQNKISPFKNKVTALGGIFTYTIMYIVLLYGDKCGFVHINLKYMYVSVIFACIYAICLYFINSKNVLYISNIVVMIVIVEMIVSNNGSIYDRDIFTKEATKVYQADEATELIDFLNIYDDGVYRVEKTYGVASLNDSVAQGYNGFSSYISVFPASISQYISENNIPPLMFGTCIDIPSDRFVIQTLLGGKYVITDKSVVFDSILYDEIYQSETKVLYESKYSLPFGYMYFSQINKDDLYSLDVNTRDSALTKGFYLTDEEQVDIKINYIDVAEVNNNEYISSLKSLAKVKMENIEFSNNMLHGYVNNMKSDGMLCIPIFFDENWRAYINGEECEIYNINGGLIGIPLSEGEYEIELEYYNIWLRTGGLISIISWSIYLLVILISHLKKNRI